MNGYSNAEKDPNCVSAAELTLTAEERAATRHLSQVGFVERILLGR